MGKFDLVYTCALPLNLNGSALLFGHSDVCFILEFL